MVSVVARTSGSEMTTGPVLVALAELGREHAVGVQVHAVVAHADPAADDHDRVALQARRELLVRLAHEHDRDLAREVLDLDHAVLVAALAATRCCTLVTRPAIVTVSPSCVASDDISSVMVVEACFASGASSPASGWSET